MLAGLYGKSILGGVMGDFLGATICMLELVTYLALAADREAFTHERGEKALSALSWLALVLVLPQVHGWLRRRLDRPAAV